MEIFDLEPNDGDPMVGLGAAELEWAASLFECDEDSVEMVLEEEG